MEIKQYNIYIKVIKAKILKVIFYITKNNYKNYFVNKAHD